MFADSCHALNSPSMILNYFFLLLFSPCSGFFALGSHSWITGWSWCCNFGNFFFINELMHLVNMGIFSLKVTINALFEINIVVFQYASGTVNTIWLFHNDLYLVPPTRSKYKIKTKINLYEENLNCHGKFNTIFIFVESTVFFFLIVYL